MRDIAKREKQKKQLHSARNTIHSLLVGPLCVVPGCATVVQRHRVPLSTQDLGENILYIRKALGGPGPFPGKTTQRCSHFQEKKREAHSGKWPGAWESVRPHGQSSPGLFTWLPDIKLSMRLGQIPRQTTVIIQPGCSLPGLLLEAHPSPREL